MNAVARPDDLLRVQAGDPAYVEAARAEAAFWQNPHPYGLESIEQRFPNDGPVERNANSRFTGNPRVRWYETIAGHGPFAHGLLLGTSSLGAEARILETNPALALTIIDISPGALERRARALGARFPGRLRTNVADLNFLDLPADSYDLIVSASSLHHVTNLEHCAWQMNHALTPGGYAFVHDYVGEPRFQFSATKRRIFELLWDREMARDGLRGPGVRWMDDSDLSPFCGRRSDETLGILRTYLAEESLRTRGALSRGIQRCTPAGVVDARPTAKARRVLRRFRARSIARVAKTPPLLVSDRLLRDLFLVGDVLADAGILLPSNAFGVYRKRTGQRGAG